MTKLARRPDFASSSREISGTVLGSIVQAGYRMFGVNGDFGYTIDIHGGGSRTLLPHHNEIAQPEDR